MNRCGLAQWNVRLLMMCGQALAMSGDGGGVPPCGTGSKTRTGFLKWALVGFFFINHGLVCTLLQSEGFSGQ